MRHGWLRKEVPEATVCSLRGGQLTKERLRDGLAAAMIHDDRSQSQRNGALTGFQERRFQVWPPELR